MAAMRYHWQEIWLILKGYITCDCIFRCYKVYDVLANLEEDFLMQIFIFKPQKMQQPVKRIVEMKTTLS